MTGARSGRGIAPDGRFGPLEPVEPPAADAVERAAGRLRAWAARHPVAAQRLRLAWRVWAWVSLPLLLAVLVLVPQARHGIAGALWAAYPAAQLFLLARTKTLTVAGFARLVLAGGLAALLTLVWQAGLAASAGVELAGSAMSVWAAGPTEELWHLLPLAALAVAARNRVRGFGAADWLVAGGAVGAGFVAVEDAARRVAIGTPPRTAG